MSAFDTTRFANLLAEDRFADPLWAGLPISELVCDRLADVLFGVDEILGFLGEARGSGLQRLEPQFRRLFIEVDELMREISN